MAEIRMNKELADLFGMGRALENVQGEATNNVEYAFYVEHGTKKAAAQPMIGGHEREYEAMLEANLRRAYDEIDDLDRAAFVGVTEATLEITRAIADRTPVDVGRLKGGWVARLPNGREERFGPAISAERQRRMRNARRERIRKRADRMVERGKVRTRRAAYRRLREKGVIR